MSSHRRTVVLVGCLAAALAVAFGLSRVPEQTHATEIIPSYSIGPVVLGESGSSVLARLGHGLQRNYGGATFIRAPNAVVPNPYTPGVVVFPRRTVVTYKRLGLTMVIADTGPAPDQVMTISTSDPRYRTADGLGVGSRVSQFHSSKGVICSPGYGRPSVGQCNLNPPFWGQAWTIYWTKNGRVSHITVMEPTPGVPQGADVVVPPGLHLNAGV